MKPSIGRIVHFHPSEGTTHAAIIVAVHSDTYVNLVVFGSDGLAYGRASVQLLVPGRGKPEFSAFCEWPAHQVDKANGCLSVQVSQATADALERIIQKIDEKLLEA